MVNVGAAVVVVVVVVLVVVDPEAAVVAVPGPATVVTVGSGGSLVVVAVVAVVAGAIEELVDAGPNVVDVVGAPIAAGVSTTLSRIPATAVDAIITDTAVATSHATPKPSFRLIRSSMQQTQRSWVNPRLNQHETTAIEGVRAPDRCKF